MKKSLGIILFVLAISTIAYYGINFYVKTKADQIIAELQTQMGPDAKLTYEEVFVNPVQVSGSIRNLKAVNAMGETTVEELVYFPMNNTFTIHNVKVDDQKTITETRQVIVSKYEKEGELPVDVALEIVDLKVTPKTEDESSKEYLRVFGKDGMLVNTKIDWQLDTKDKTARYNVEFLKLGNLMTSNSSFQLNGIDYELLMDYVTKMKNKSELTQEYKNKAMTSFSGISIVNFSLGYKDRGLIDAMTDLSAAESKKTPEEERKDMIARVLKDREKFEKIGLESLSNAIEKLLKREASEIEISANPEMPVSAGQMIGFIMMQQYPALVKQLNIKITAK